MVFELKSADLYLIFGLNLGIILWFAFFCLFIFPKRKWDPETSRRPRSFISNAYFREFWYYLIARPKRFLIQNNASPNALTWAGFVLSVVAGACFILGYLGFGGWLVVAGSTFDMLDGHVARARKLTLKSGAFFDSVLDRVGEVFMFFGLMWFFRTEPVWWILIFAALTSSQVVSYARARAEGLGFDGQGGFFQRAERMITISMATILAPAAEYFFGGGMLLLKTGLIVVSVGSLWTMLERPWRIYRALRTEEL